MDGNGRWAEQRGLPRLAGHREGVSAIPRVVDTLARRGVQFLTIYAFSTENWDRPADEVSFLMDLIPERLEAERSMIFEQRVRIRVLGEIETLPLIDRVAVQDIVRQTSNHDALDLNIAFNYGGRAEIVRALRNLIRDGVRPEDVTEDMVSRAMYTAGQPDPDLLIRTGGDQRSSNFLVWQSTYSEYYFSPTLWPDFTREAFEQALADFASRQRRFGRVPVAAPAAASDV
jgi:undecaprenyl diphosphate synthase